MSKRFNIPNIETDPDTYARNTSISKLVDLLKSANEMYYNSDQQLLSDEAYDIIKDVLQERDPNNKLLKEVGAEIADKNKVKLPYWMGSMTKIKKDDGNLAKWKATFNGPYIISDKLDGISGLMVYNNKKLDLYSRGNGSEGSNLNHLIPHLNIPEEVKGTKDIVVVRGEFVIPKTRFNEINKEGKYTNARSYVAGIINHKTVYPEMIKTIDFVAYELIHPWTTSSSQMSILKSYGFNVVHHSEATTITDKYLSELYMERIANCDYEIDGLIITDNHLHPRNTNDNPKYSRAFKMDRDMFETIVTGIEWNASKDGLLKPVVIYNPVIISGNTHTRATANNARFILDNMIGIGTVIKIVRSNEVLPKIASIIKPATKNKMVMPEEEYEWNDNHVEFVLVDKDSNDTVSIKRLVRFFTTLEIDNISEGVITQLYNAGYKTIDSIVKATPDDLTKLDRIGDRLAEKLVNNIHKVVDKPIKLETIMKASNIFENGFGERKLKIVTETFPDLLTRNLTIDEIIELPGWNTKTATAFMAKLPEFKTFMTNHSYLKVAKLVVKVANTNETFVFSGFRDKNLENQIETKGGHVSGSVSKNTTAVITTDVNGDSGKVSKAKELGVKVMTPEEFKKFYGLS